MFSMLPVSCYDEENWQTTRETIRERNKFMFNNSLLSDVTFVVHAATKGNRKKRRVTFAAHKYVLAIGSPVFFAMFYGDLAEKGDTVDLPDCDSEGLKELLRYIYCDEAELTGSNVLQVWSLAKKYIVPSLAEKCREFLDENLNDCNVFSVLPSVITYEAKDLLKKCWQLIDKQGNEAVKSEPFKCIDKTLLSSVLERSTMNCSEVTLFKAVISWASKECRNQRLAHNGANKRKVLGEELVKLLRFPLMTEAEFANTVLPTGMLDKQEIVDMFMYFNGAWPKALRFSTASRGKGTLLRFTRFHRHHRFSYSETEVSRSNSVTFSVSRQIFVLGVTIYGFENYTHSVEFAFCRKGSPEKLFSKKCSYSSVSIESRPGTYYGFDVMFNKPILVPAGEEYTIRAIVTGREPWYGEGETSCTECEEVKFRFSNSSSHVLQSAVLGAPSQGLFGTSYRIASSSSNPKGQFPRIIFRKA